MTTTSGAVRDKRRRHHAARAHGRRRSARKDGIGSKGQHQQPPLQPTREACLLQGALNYKPDDGKMAARDGDEMCGARYRKPIARRLGAQLGRASTDNAGNERARWIGLGRDNGKELVPKPSQRPRRTLVDRYQPDDVNLSKLAPKHA